MSALSRSLVTPRKVASVLDWSRKPVMALDIAENHVGICIGGRPSPSSSRHQGDAIRRLDPIRLHSSSSHEVVAERIDELAKEHNVCAVVVGWPLQPEGNVGKPCGKVLHTLENLIESSKSGIVSRRRPLTLWDDRHVSPTPASSSSSSSHIENEIRSASSSTVEKDQPPDRWGRCVAFARAPTSKDGETYSSRHAYARPTAAGEDGSERASGILEHFLGSVYDERETSTGGGGSGTKEEVDYHKVTNDSWEEECEMLL